MRPIRNKGLDLDVVSHTRHQLLRGQPRTLLRVLVRLVRTLPPFDRVSVGFPGAVADGRVLTAANLYHRGWIGFDLGGALEAIFRRPVRVAHDVALQGLGAIRGRGFELVVTLGTGVGSALFLNGLLVPQFSLSRYEARPHTTYDVLLNDAALKDRGEKKWNKRLKEAIGMLRYIRQRYGTPENAWAQYGKGHEGY